MIDAVMSERTLVGAGLKPGDVVTAVGDTTTVVSLVSGYLRSAWRRANRHRCGGRMLVP